MSETPDGNTCHAHDHVWMQGCATCFEERIRADEREKAAQRFVDAFLYAIAAARGEDNGHE